MDSARNAARATAAARQGGSSASGQRPMVTEIEERALVARAKAGDAEAFDALVRHHADRLYAVVLRFSATRSDAEEATQEAFVRAWRSIGRFRSDARFFTWLYRIGVNEAKRIAQRAPSADAVVSAEDHPVEDVADPRAGPSQRAEQSELRDTLEHALRRLPEKYRSAVVLRDIEGLATTEAAKALGLQEAAFKSRLHRGRMVLRAELAHYVLRDRRSGTS